MATVKSVKEKLVAVTENGQVARKELEGLSRIYNSENMHVLTSMIVTTHNELAAIISSMKDSDEPKRGRPSNFNKEELETIQALAAPLNEKIKEVFEGYKGEHSKSYDMDRLEKETTDYIKAIEDLIAIDKV